VSYVIIQAGVACMRSEYAFLEDFMDAHPHTYTCVCEYIHTICCMYIYIYIYVCVCVCVCVCTYIYIGELCYYTGGRGVHAQ